MHELCGWPRTEHAPRGLHDVVDQDGVEWEGAILVVVVLIQQLRHRHSRRGKHLAPQLSEPKIDPSVVGSKDSCDRC